MLAELSIRDVVLIDRLDLAFASGLSALTGETGAGKSILLDALGLALGARGESALVRHGAEQATVAATFVLSDDAEVRALLDDLGIAAEDTLRLRRVLGADGRSRAFVNDSPVGVAALRRFGDLLVEVHGQFAQQGLLDPASHRRILDAFAGLARDRDRVAAAHGAWRAAEAAAAAAAAALAEARQDEAYLRHAASELRALAPQPGEENRLAEARALRQHHERFLDAVRGALGELDGDRGAESRLGAALRLLDRVAEPGGPRLAEAVAAIERGLAELREGMAGLEELATGNGDARNLEELEERLFALRAAARKHAVPVDGLADLAAGFESRLAALDDGAGGLAERSAAAARARADYETAAGRLSEARRAAAKRLDAAVRRELAPLRLDKARFVTEIETAGEDHWGAGGWDRVQFAAATNPGTPPGPIARIASGGELSRFMLALKVVLAKADPVSTLVFDEVDAGVGGAVADAVGERLARLAETVQVLVVTHSPQVAARASHHWRVEKASRGGGARTGVVGLDPGERREEIARMLSGAEVTAEARSAADRLLRHDVETERA